MSFSIPNDITKSRELQSASLKLAEPAAFIFKNLMLLSIWALFYGLSFAALGQEIHVMQYNKPNMSKTVNTAGTESEARRERRRQAASCWASSQSQENSKAAPRRTSAQYPGLSIGAAAGAH
jgi:hypothetical protein